jgi:hypothetical protein
MSKGKDSDLDRPVGAPVWPGRWVSTTFLLFLCGLSPAAAALLLRDGKGWVLLVALVSGALLWGLEHLEIRYLPGSRPTWNGYLLPMITILLATFAAYLPTLEVNFNSDAIAYIHLFHTPSLRQFLRLFHTDLSQGTGGVNLQELRPLYGLSYMLSYSLWGLHPICYHLTGILVHVLNSLMVFLIARNMAPRESWRAWIAGLLFALLPANAENLGSINGTLTEGVPCCFYLFGFLCFVFFRRTGLTRYLVVSTTSFTACLLSKETAVTLPVMLASYDLFRITVGEYSISLGDSPHGRNQWRRTALPYAPFATLLLAYLAMRRIAFPSFLKEDGWERTWGTYAGEGGSGLTGLPHQLAHLTRYFGTLQAFNLRHLLLPFPASVLWLVLGLYLVWVFSLLRQRSRCRRSIAVLVYFGLVWYLISNAPLLAIPPSIGHVYLPSAGPCIATAFLALPACEEPRKRAVRLRLLGAAFLVCLSACQLWKENTKWAGTWRETLAVPPQLVAAVAGLPKQTLVIVWYAESGLPTSRVSEEYLPYALQPPFTHTDLYSRMRIIEAPEMYCCPLPQWWEKSRSVLAQELAGAPDDLIDIDLFAWDWQSCTFQSKRRIVPKSLLRACLVKLLGGPAETSKLLSPDSADRLMEALARLVMESG